MYKNLLLLLMIAFSGALQAQDCLPIILGIDSYIEQGGPAYVEWQLTQNGESVESGIAQFSLDDPWYDAELCLAPGCYDLAIFANQPIDPNSLFAYIEPLEGWITDLQSTMDGQAYFADFCIEGPTACELDVVYTPLDCGNHLFDIVSVDADWWGFFVNGELVADNVLMYEFDAEAPGIYEVTVMYETPECPNGVFWDTTIEVTEDCFNEINCEAEIFIEGNACDGYTFILGADNSMFDVYWTYNGVDLDIPNNQYVVFADAEEGGNVICATLFDTANECELFICEDFFVEPCEVECEIGVWVDSIDCNTYVFGAETNMDNPVIDWFVNGEYVNQGNIYTFYTEVPGDYQICALYETPDCPMGVQWCETFVVTEDCIGSDCPLSISYEEHTCDSFTFTEDNGTQVAWTVNGEFYAYFHGIDFDPTEPGTYEICATYETEDCPLGVTACEILVITEDCFEDDCAFDVEIEQQSCAEYNLFATGEEILDWYVNDVFQLTSTGYDFYPNSPGTYEICAVNEGCPPETNICETFVITEDCLETECPLSISYEEHTCDSFTFTEDNGTQVAWTVNGEFYAYFHGIDFDPTEPGTYEICATYETEDCPLGVTACEILVITEDCIGSDCPQELILSYQQECGNVLFTLPGFENMPGVTWYIDDITTYENAFGISEFWFEENGTYQICAYVENDLCPDGAELCETIEIDCYGNDPCEVEAAVSQVGCEIAYYNLITELPEGVFANVYLNEEFLWEGNSGSFSVEPGLNYLCVEYEHPDCEEVVTWCEDFYIEECLCPEYIDVWVEDCLVMASIPQSDGTGWVDWFFNGEYYQGGDVITFEAPANGEYELCAFYYSEICQGVDLCTIVGVDGCEEEGDCYMEGYLTEVECGQWQLDLFGDLPWEVSPQIYLDDELIGEGLIALFNVEEGWHYICASYYHEDCDGEVEWCYEFYVPGCDNDCFIAMEYDEVDALTYLFEVDAPDNATVYWTINDLDAGIGLDQNYTFLPGEQYEVCAFYETPECPWGMMACANIYTAPEMECTPVIFYLEMLEDFDVDVDIEYVIEGLGLELEGLITIQEECGSTFLEICVPDGCYEMTMGLEDLGEYALFLSILVDDLPGVNYQVDLLEQTVTMEFGVNQDCDDTNVEEVVENALLIYPNPNTGQFYVEHNYNAEDLWEIVDLSGRLVQQGQFNQPRLSINVNDLSAGSYLFRVMGSKSQTVERIQIIR